MWDTASMWLVGAAGALVAAASDLSFNAMGYLAVLGNDLMTCEGPPPRLRSRPSADGVGATPGAAGRVEGLHEVH